VAGGFCAITLSPRLATISSSAQQAIEIPVRENRLLASLIGPIMCLANRVTPCRKSLASGRRRHGIQRGRSGRVCQIASGQDRARHEKVYDCHPQVASKYPECHRPECHVGWLLFRLSEWTDKNVKECLRVTYSGQIIPSGKYVTKSDICAARLLHDSGCQQQEVRRRCALPRMA